MHQLFKKMSHRMNKMTLTLLASLAIAPSLPAASWYAQPIIVHEWGVNTYDWSGKAQQMPVFPDFIYTDQKPGIPTSNKNIVKQLPPDSGIRFKPLLYFYPLGIAPIKVGVEVRFAFGYANAWYPQVDIYRTAAQVKEAKPPVVRDKSSPTLIGVHPLPPAPNDERFELVWNELSLTPGSIAPQEAKMKDDLPALHWIHDARNVDAATVSNGTGGEAEKFVFYEGINTEGPKICIIPEGNAYSVVNTGNHTIYDVTCIFRSGGVRYSTHIDELPPMPQQVLDSGKGAAVIPAMNLPALLSMKVDALSASEQQKSDQEMVAREMSALVDDLTKGGALLPQNVMMRDPADAQPATTMHTLYQKEAEGLAKIWRKDFFEQEGFTIIYRESPAYLDLAMPLNLYTDMYHYILLNRCGLVCNNHIPLAKLGEIHNACQRLLWFEKSEPKDIQLCKENLLLSKSYWNYFKKLGHDPKKIDSLSRTLSEETRDPK